VSFELAASDDVTKILTSLFEPPDAVAIDRDAVSHDITDESIQEDTTKIDGYTFINPFCSYVLEEAESSSTNQDPSNMHEFYQQHRSTDQLTKNHPLK
ncbi:hypothetical protein Tco_1431515, partial [Tanacetum coccineum]